MLRLTAIQGNGPLVLFCQAEINTFQGYGSEDSWLVEWNLGNTLSIPALTIIYS